MNADIMQIVVPMGALLLLMVLRVPVAFSLMGAGLLGLVMLTGIDPSGFALGSTPFSATAKYALTVIPMFILMGLFISYSGMLIHVFRIANRYLGRFPGGLGIATVAACTIFGGVSGSSVADAATLGRLSIGEMNRQGYPKAFAAAIVASAGTIAILIPPSIALVLYGSLTGESVGALLLAGIIPGFITAVAYCVTIVLRVRRVGLDAAQEEGALADTRLLAPASAGSGGVEAVNLAGDSADLTGGELGSSPKAGSGDRVEAFFSLGSMISLFALVIGGMYAGWFTATEAGAFGAICALLVSVAFVLLSKAPGRTLRAWSVIKGSLQETGGLTSMIFALVVGATLFTQYLVVAGIPHALSSWVLSLDVPPFVVVAALIIFLLPLGMFVDGLSILLIITPIAHPIVTGLGYDGIWLGILIVKAIEIGLITPPLGLNVYVVSGLFEDLKTEAVFRQVQRFVVADLCVTALIFVVPALATWLPSMASLKA